MRFENNFCVNPVCSPNRATCLTGRMPSEHGVHRWLGTEEPSAQMGPDAYCTIDEFASLPRILTDEGYVCGHTGKWHLGDSARPQLGFEYWYAMAPGWAPWRPVIGERPDFMPAGLLGPHAWDSDVLFESAATSVQSELDVSWWGGRDGQNHLPSTTTQKKNVALGDLDLDDEVDSLDLLPGESWLEL